MTEDRLATFHRRWSRYIPSSQQPDFLADLAMLLALEVEEGRRVSESVGQPE